MAQNYLSISGTVQGVQGNDSKAPYPYWSKYTYRPVTSGELSSLRNGNVQTQALSLSPGQYTCLEISFDEPVYVSQFRCYLSTPTSPIEVALSYPHLTENPTSFIVDLSQDINLTRENVRSSARYYDRVSDSVGYIEGDPVDLLANEYVQLIDAVYMTTHSGSLPFVQTGFEEKQVKQIIKVEGDLSGSRAAKLQLTAPPSDSVSLDQISIAPIDTQEEVFDFSEDTLDDDRRDELRYWYSDEGNRGHFEGEIFPIEEGATITGTWAEYLTWSGASGKSETLDLKGHTIRQTIPSRMLSHLGDGIRVTLSGAQGQDIQINHMSYMPSNSSEVRLEFGPSLEIYRENLKNNISRWKNDGTDEEGWEGQLSRHFGHFESYEVDVDDGSAAIMYDANVIGIPCQSHGLKAGDYIRIYGTEFYDGYYYILSYSTPHIIVIWGIFDPENFTSAAKIRRIVSLGPKFDDYGVKQGCRAVIPYVEVNFVTGTQAHILDYTDFGKLHGSVKLGPDEFPTTEVSSIYDIVVDNGWLCNTPGPATTPDFEQSVPDTTIQKSSRIWAPRHHYDDAFATPDIGSYHGGYSILPGIPWKGNISCISESQDPEYEGNATGTNIDKLFDRTMAQPWWTLVSLDDCPWITMSYRGPIPVKFILDMGEPVLFSKYRQWIQLWICPPETVIGFPKSWKVEASNHGNNNLEWDELEHVADFVLDEFVPSEFPTDLRVPFSCADGPWTSYRNVELYRYYRFHIYESWTCTRTPGHFECAHVDEIDFVEHRCSAGIFPTVIDTTLYMDRISQIIPDEHLRGGSKIFYALSFDDGNSFEVYRHDIEAWRTIAREVDDQWQYFDGLVWRTTDLDKAEENTVKFALWYAFSVMDNRMDFESIYRVPEAAYQSKIPSGGYVKFAVGLCSSGKIEAMLKGITISGTVFNPIGSDSPTEVTFNNGESGCLLPAGQTITSDWINDDLVSQRDALFVMDLHTTASSVPLFDGYGHDITYFHRSYVPSYDLQVVEPTDYTLASGVVLIDHVDSRFSESITLPIPGHNLPVGAYIRVSGTFGHYDAYHDVYKSRTDQIEIVSKHWVTDNPVPPGAYVQRRYSIGPGNMQPHTQVGSVLEFDDVGSYIRNYPIEVPATDFYYVTGTASCPLNPPANAFDPDPDIEYHSGQPIDYGTVALGIGFNHNKRYDRFRLKSSLNDWFWYREFPSLMTVDGSNYTSPSLENDSQWTTIWSGSPSVPIGPGRYSDWHGITGSGDYTSYRIKIEDNYGEWYDAVRLSHIDLVDSSSTSGVEFTLLDVPVGFDSKYLFDGSTHSEYGAFLYGVYPMVSVDFKNNPKELSRLRLRAAYGTLSGIRWDTSYPKAMLICGSNEHSPDLGEDSEWEILKTYVHPPVIAEGQWGDWISMPSGVNPYRHYGIKFFTNQAGGPVTTVTSYVNATDVLPKKIFTLPVGGMITEVKVETPTVFRGGYTGGCGNIGSGSVGHQHIDQCYYSDETNMAPQADLPLEYGRYIVQAGIRRRGGAVTWMKFQRVQIDGSSVAWDDTCYQGNGDAIYDIPENRFTCGTYGDTAGQWVVDWKELYFGPYKHTDLGVYYPVIRTAWTFRTNTNNDVSFSTGGNSWMRIVGATSTLPPPNNKSGDFVALGARVDVAFRYGNMYSVTAEGTYNEFVTNFQPYAVTETETWAGTYGPHSVIKDVYLDIQRPYGVRDTSGQIKVTISYTSAPTDHVMIRASEVDFESNVATSQVTFPSYSNNYPMKLYDLPPWYELTGGVVFVQTGFNAVAETIGNVASGTVDNSFWTVVDRHWKLENSRAISQIGVYANQPTIVSLKIFKQRSSEEWFDITEIQDVTHSGTGFQWFTLNRPYLVPDTGDQYLGWYQPNFPVKMAEATGSGLVSYQYGNYTGTNINLPLHNSMKPCIAAKYLDCFSIGTDDDPELLCPMFSPAVVDRQWVVGQLDYTLDSREIKMYRQCSLTQSGTQGLMRVVLYYKDLNDADYGTLDYSIQDNGSVVRDRTAQSLVDSNRSTDLFSHRETRSGDPLMFISRFDTPVRLVAFRYRPSSVLGLFYFPSVVELLASDSLQDPFDTLAWTTIYEDSAYHYGDPPDYWGPWVYMDHYENYYRHYIFKLSYYFVFDYTAAVGDIELLIEYNGETVVVVPEVYNAVQGITNEGMFEKEVTTRSHPGMSRHLYSIWDTFSSYGKTELSPGTYFYRGENTPWSENTHPVRVTKIENGVEQEIQVTHPVFAGMNILAWHPMDEEDGNFRDLSGNALTANRVGQLDSMIGRQGWGATYKEDDQAEGNVRFTLPHHLDEYTVSFWFMPKHDIHPDYETKFDIMGGWITYGAIPGVWHISVSKHMMYTEDPYPSVQEGDLVGPGLPGIGNFGSMCFGNYGARLETGRNYWKHDSWYHVVFAFRPGATASNPYKCWINGVPDDAARFYGYDTGKSVYPPTDVIMADPDDIHYDTHDKHNCMYFGLPLQDGPGLSYEFGLQHVMHFNKILNDEEVFKLYRLRHTLSNDWDGIYFADTEAVESPGKIIVDFGTEKCITKYGLITPSGATDDVWWKFVGSGVEVTTLDEQYDDFINMPDYYNILNPNGYQYYIFDILGSDDKADYLFINGIRLVDVPRIPTVSGTYSTLTSGVQNEDSNILEFSIETYVPSGAQVELGLSRDGWQTWVPEAQGSGTLYTKHTFTSDPILEYPAVLGMETIQTTWSAGSPTVVTIDTNFSNGEVVDSEWFQYILDQSKYHFVILDFSPSGGNPSYSENGYGYFVDGAYIISGSLLVSEIEARSNEIVAIKADSVAGVEPGNIVGIQDAGPFSGYWYVASGMSSDLWIYAPYEDYQVQAGATYRRVIEEAFNVGSEIVMASGTTVVVSTDGSIIRLEDDLPSQEITAVYDSLIGDHGVEIAREVRVDEQAGEATNVIHLNLTSNTTPSPYRVFESTEDQGLYRLLDGTVSGSKSVTSMVIDLGEQTVVNSYRWFYDYPTGPAPDYWEVYGSNELPHWDELAAETDTTFEWGWSENYDLTSVSGYRYYLFKFYEEVQLREIELLRKNVPLSTGVVVVKTSASGVWNYSEVGRLSMINVLSDEPDTTHIFHGVTFDGGTTYKIFDSAAWESVVRLNGATWQYWDGSWNNSSENSVYGAFRGAVEEASQMFSTTQLEAVQEMDWHGTGAIQTTSGSLGFISYLYGASLSNPRLKGYQALYQTLPSGITGLIEDGFSYHNIGVVQDGVKPESGTSPSIQNLFDKNPDTYYYGGVFYFSLGKKQNTSMTIIGLRLRARNTPGSTDWLTQFPTWLTFQGYLSQPSWGSTVSYLLYQQPVAPPKTNSGWSDWIPTKSYYSEYHMYSLSAGGNMGIAEIEFLVSAMPISEGKEPLFRDCVTHTFVPESDTEKIYDRKLLSNLRVYLANPTALGITTSITEVAMVDCQTPNNDYYLSTNTHYTQGDPIYNKMTYNYQHTNALKDLKSGCFSYSTVSGYLFAANYHEYYEGVILTYTNLVRMPVHMRNRFTNINEMPFSGDIKIVNQDMVQSILKDDGTFLFFEPWRDQVYVRKLDYSTYRTTNWTQAGYLYPDADYVITSSGLPSPAYYVHGRDNPSTATAIPPLNANNARGYVTSDSYNGTGGGYAARNAYDGIVGTNTYNYIQYPFPLWNQIVTPVDKSFACNKWRFIPTGYRTNHPKRFYLQAFGAHGWVNLDTTYSGQDYIYPDGITNPSHLGGVWSDWFTFSNTTKYSTYRMVTVSGHGSDSTGINLDEIQLVDATKPPESESESFWSPCDDKIWLMFYKDNIEFWNTSLSGSMVWNKYYEGPGPSSRTGSSIVYDRNDHCIWMLGGYFIDPLTNTRYVYADFWKFDIHQKLWTEVNTTSFPSKRFGTSMAMNTDNNQIILFGGSDGVGNLADTWVYDKRWNTWTDMTDIYGKPYISPTATATGIMDAAFFYDNLRKNFILIGGGLPLNILDVIDPYEQSYFFGRKNYTADYFMGGLTDEHIYTGGILLNEGESSVFQLTDVPPEKKLYYADVRLYYDPALGPPSGVGITTMSGNQGDMFTVTNWKKEEDHMYAFIWSDLPLENLSLDVHNTRITASGNADGPIRVHELALFPLTYSGTWNVENNFNLIESGHTTTVTGVDGMGHYIFQVLPTPHLERLISESEGPIPLLPGHAIGLQSDFNEFGGKSQEIRVYTDSPSGVDINFMTQVSGEQSWNTYLPTWNGSSFSYIFWEPENARVLKINIANSNAFTTSGIVDATHDQIRWIKAVQLINCGDEIDFGTTGSGENTLELPTYYRDYNKISIYNNNRSGTPANARVLPRFSGNYHLDRTIRISEDTVNWGTIEDGVRFPEDYPWEMGKMVNTRVSEDQVLLQDTAVSGTWRSPVIEVLDPSSMAAYVYVKNIQYEQSYVNEDYVSINNIMKVRSGPEKPMQLFLATGVNTDNEYALQAPWKTVLFRSDGNPVKTVRYYIYVGGAQGWAPVYNELNLGGQDVNDLPKPPRRYWSSSEPCLWQFYGALDSRGFAGLTLGLQWAESLFDPMGVEEDSYKFYQAFPSNGTYDAGWGENESSIGIFNSNWVFLPIFNKTLREVFRAQGSTSKHSWQMVDVVYRPYPFYELYEEQYFSDKVFHARNLYKFHGAAATPEHDCEIDYLYSFEGTLIDLETDKIRCAACCDNIVPEGWGNYYWMHYACESDESPYYRTLLVNSTAVEREFDHIERKFNFIVEAGEGTPTRGFWGITQTAVFWYSYDGASLVEEFGVTADNTSAFKRIHHGCTDYMNNLWFVDLATERVIRVNYRTKAVDYSRVIPGVASVACDPYDNSAYLYVIRAPEFPTQDCIKLVHVGDYDYLEPEPLCAVPNVAMLDSFNINLVGRSTSPMGYYDVLPEDPVWGEGPGSIPWVNYSAASPTLPKGIYKQFKLTLRRSDLEAASPEIDYLRIPVPSIINKIPWKGYKDIFVDTIPRSQNYDLPAGTHTLDLLVWWTRE